VSCSRSATGFSASTIRRVLEALKIPPARVPQGSRGRAAGQQVPYPGPGARRLPSAWVPGRRDAGQGITEPVRQASLIGEIDVEPVEDAAGQQLPRLRCPV
jgi:hypothetical protein